MIDQAWHEITAQEAPAADGVDLQELMKRLAAAR